MVEKYSHVFFMKWENSIQQKIEIRVNTINLSTAKYLVDLKIKAQ
jgi:hypothetical protein